VDGRCGAGKRAGVIRAGHGPLIVRPRILAIHGAVANAATWIPLRRCLGEAADLDAGDLPGHGERAAERFAFEAAVAELTAGVMTESSRRPTIVVGDSLGGYLALAVAARAGGAVSGVIAGSCTYPMRGPSALLARASLLADPFIPPGAVTFVMRHSCAPDVAEAIVRRGLNPALRGATLRALLGYDVLRDIAAIRAPIVFIAGAFDIPIAWCLQRFVRAAPRARGVIVPRATHGVGLTHPAVFARAALSLSS
jgi:pimeloyl-ACP methyl ester carboxylesterase